MVRQASTIDDYLKGVPAPQRRSLQQLRKAIHAAAPGLVECISYRMPAFRLDGVVVAGFAARAEGCSYFPFSGTTLKTLARELSGYEQTKSSLHFETEKPLSAALVRKLVKARAAERRRPR